MEFIYKKQKLQSEAHVKLIFFYLLVTGQKERIGSLSGHIRRLWYRAIDSSAQIRVTRYNRSESKKLARFDEAPKSGTGCIGPRRSR